MPLVTTEDLKPFMSRIAHCPMCGSDDVTRMPGTADRGPVDLCTGCSHAWAHKPGTLTKRQARMKRLPPMPVMETKAVAG